ncbi:hypothetical protein XacyCFBP2565_21955 [Xanthomonas arboricola pv. corylina]|nr:hypothetical protein XacyCFBP2565_21955 [Xanthomonas arboricola pv. corylina]
MKRREGQIDALGIQGFDYLGIGRPGRLGGFDFRQQLPEPGALGTLGVFPRRQFPQCFLGCLVLHAGLICWERLLMVA